MKKHARATNGKLAFLITLLASPALLNLGLIFASDLLGLVLNVLLVSPR